MEDKSNYIKKLLVKYKENRISASEFEELVSLMTDHESTLKSEMSAHWRVNYSSLTNKRSKTNKRRLVYMGIAASLLFIVGMWYALSDGRTQDQPIVYRTGNGEVLNIELSDGSTVKLNANSELTVAADFDENIMRQVRLEGEAYFKVTKTLNENQEKRGFQVKTTDIVIDVLGTTFNVNARNGVEKQEVYLEEGSIHFQIEDGDKKPLLPGEKIVYDDKTSEIFIEKNIDVDGAASWTKGILRYHDQALSDVLKNLELLFGISLIYGDDIDGNRRINLGVPYMDWENTKKALELSLEIIIKKESNGYLIVNNDQTSDSI